MPVRELVITIARRRKRALPKHVRVCTHCGLRFVDPL